MACLGQPGNGFVVQPEKAEKKPTRQGTSQTYRCGTRIYNRLNRWLKANGVSNRNAIHALRHEFASIVVEQLRPFEAAKQLSHTQINLVYEVYADSISKTAVDLDL